MNINTEKKKIDKQKYKKIEKKQTQIKVVLKTTATALYHWKTHIVECF